MRRRDFLRTAALAAAGAVLAKPATSSAKPSRRPNILFIMTDQQHAGMMSCTGNTWLRTPAMDWLAASGIRFERAYASNPVCAPSRFSFQTGLMPSAIGVGKNEDKCDPAAVDASRDQSLGRLFGNAGYEAVYGGKVHLPNPMGGADSLGYRVLTADERQGLADACVAFIKGHHTKPFLMFASFINPHDICRIAMNDFSRVNGQPLDDCVETRVCESVLDQARNSGDLTGFIEKHCPPLPANFEVPEAEPECIAREFVDIYGHFAHARNNWSRDQWRLYRWVYCRLTEMVDAEIGLVLEALREAGLEDQTLVVLTSDHGDLDSAHRLQQKMVLYEESVRVPMVMSFKGVVPEGRTDDRHLVSNGLDLLPTLCDYAGIEPPAGLHGRSLLPLANGKKVRGWRKYVVSETKAGRMLRTDRFKYCVYDSGKHREQLTDLQEDPGEMNNLAESPRHARVLSKHRRLLREWVEQTGDRIAARYIV